jgi:hypothetical protein
MAGNYIAHSAVIFASILHYLRNKGNNALRKLIFYVTNPLTMVVFNTSILENWKSNGYRFILVLPRDKYGVLRPLNYDKPLTKGYTIEISEVSLLQIAQDYFLTTEKDAAVLVNDQKS